jgi:hypothetical protein
MAARGRLTRSYTEAGSGTTKAYRGGRAWNMHRNWATSPFCCIRAMGSGDIPFCERLASRQRAPLGIGTDPRERWLVGAFRAQTAGVGGCFPGHPRRPAGLSRGDGRLGGRPALRLPGLPAIPFRLTIRGWPCRARPVTGRAHDPALVRGRRRAQAGDRRRGDHRRGPTPCGTMSPDPPPIRGREARSRRAGAGDHERNDYICTSRTGCLGHRPIGRDRPRRK